MNERTAVQIRDLTKVIGNKNIVDGPQVKGLTLDFSITMLIVSFVVMNILAWSFFVKRDVEYT